MRFDSLDEFLRYYYENKVNIADVEFTISAVAAEDPAATPDVVAEPPVEVAPEEEKTKLQEFTMYLASGDLSLTLDSDGYLVVDDYAMTPNACGTGKIVVEGRTVNLNMCEMDGRTVAYLHTSLGYNQPVAVRRKS